jgi:hypothetical protein
VVVMVANKSAPVLMLTCIQEICSSNYGHDTNYCDQCFIFFISPPQANAVIVFYRPWLLLPTSSKLATVS